MVPRRRIIIKKNRVVGRWHWEAREEIPDARPCDERMIAVGSAPSFDRAHGLARVFLEYDPAGYRWTHG